MALAGPPSDRVIESTTPVAETGYTAAVSAAQPTAERIARAKRLITDVLEGRVVGPQEKPWRSPLVAEDIVYINARGLALTEPAWLIDRIRDSGYAQSLRALVDSATRPGLSKIEDMVRFERPEFAWWAIAERVFIRPGPTHITPLTRHIIEQVLDRPEASPGVELMRVRGRMSMEGSTDVMVVYATDEDAADRVVEVLRTYDSQYPGAFVAGHPTGARQILPGIARGAEPRGEHQGVESFASLRVRLTQQALAEVEEQGGGRAVFQDRVLELFRAAGIDPNDPSRNLPDV